MQRHASAVWQGTLKEGKGTISTESGVFKEAPYSFAKRFGNEAGTNPEELIAAAHAGCFAMAFSGKLTAAGFAPEKISAKANLTLEQVQGAWTITTIHLDTTAKVPGIDRAKFEELANDAKATCPISRLLKANITLAAKLEA
jgi:osmotically inducible protein OsmC